MNDQNTTPECTPTGAASALSAGLGTFYCGTCGKVRPDDQKVQRKTSTRPTCKTCRDKFEVRMKIPEKSRDNKRKLDGKSYLRKRLTGIVPNAKVSGRPHHETEKE